MCAHFILKIDEKCSHWFTYDSW